MTTLRDAAQQALEFLRTRRLGAEAHITALEAALAEPVAVAFAGLTVRELRIPAGMTVRIDRDTLTVAPQRDPNDPILVEPNHDPSHAPYAALAEPTVPSDCADSHQPVAWMVYTEGGTSAYVTDNPNDLVGAYRALPLYTAPPQRQPLTIDECECAYHDLPNRPDWPNMATLWELLTAFVEGVRYAEKAHNIGGDK